MVNSKNYQDYLADTQKNCPRNLLIYENFVVDPWNHLSYPVEPQNEQNYMDEPQGHWNCPVNLQNYQKCAVNPQNYQKLYSTVLILHAWRFVA